MAVPTLRILSAGAAQAITERVIEEFRRDTNAEVVANFGAVGAMKVRITAGEPVDVVVLTHALIEELTGADLVEPDTRIDLGKVGTGIAVRAGTASPDVSNADTLRAALAAAGKIVCPDPAHATAGKIVLAMLDKLGIRAETETRMQLFPNGYAAMKWLAEEGDDKAIGITQVTEILPNKGVTYIGPLPNEFQNKTIYSAALACKAHAPDLARDFLKRLAAPTMRPLLEQAGYEL